MRPSVEDTPNLHTGDRNERRYEQAVGSSD